MSAFDVLRHHKEESLKDRIERFKPWDHLNYSEFRIVEADLSQDWKIVVEDENGKRYARWSSCSRRFTADLQRFCSQHEIKIPIGVTFRIREIAKHAGYNYDFFKPLPDSKLHAKTQADEADLTGEA